MNRKEDRATESNDARETYIAPQIAILGKVEDLTHGGTVPAVPEGLQLGTA